MPATRNPRHDLERGVEVQRFAGAQLGNLHHQISVSKTSQVNIARKGKRQCVDVLVALMLFFLAHLLSILEVYGSTALCRAGPVFTSHLLNCGAGTVHLQHKDVEHASQRQMMCAGKP